MSKISHWRVLPDDIFSDDRKISFIIQHTKRQATCCHNIKYTNWTRYDNELHMKVGLWLGYVNTPADIEQELTELDSAIITFYDKSAVGKMYHVGTMN